MDPPPVDPPPQGPTDFQAADLVLGQPDPSGGAPNRGGPTEANGLSNPGALAITPDGGLFIADQGNNRVVFFGSLPTSSAQPAQAALGQATLQGASGSLTRTGLNGPLGVGVGGVAGARRMAVADVGGHRVLVYDQVPLAGEAMPVPVTVIGQPDFESAMPGCAADRLNFPTSVAITPQGRLIVVDAGNHRVLVWNQVPVTYPAPAPDLVVGQSRLDRCVRNNNDENGDIPARSSLAFPQDAWSNDTRLVIADAANNRVLVWRNFPAVPLQDADFVLGHSSFTTGAPNDGGAAPTASSLQDPEGVHSDGTALAVADSLNNRVLIWRTFPDNNGQEAEVVLGHADFNRSVSNDGNGDLVPDAPTAQIFSYPLRVLLTPDSLFVSDHYYHRVLRFDR